jgi:hypothetical protein
MYQLIALEPSVASSHERYPENEVFHRYCKWHELPVDDEGFLAIKEREIRDDLNERSFSFEASPYLSLSVKELHDRFGARFIMLVRRPDRVVTSFVHKGFYRRPYHVANTGLAAGFQDQSPEAGFTSFARVSPRGQEFRRWNEMTQVGKVAWFWRAWNERTLQGLRQLPPHAYRIVRIEDLNYAEYLKLSSFLGYEARVTESDFDTLSASKPHAFWRKRNIDQWSEQEVREFEGEVGAVAQQFDYEYRIANLVDEAREERAEAQRLGQIPQKKQGRQFWRLRRGTADLLRGLGRGIHGLAQGIDVE